MPGAPWPARTNGISIRYYPVIKWLAKSHHIDLFAHSEVRRNLADDPLLRCLRHVEILKVNKRSPGLADRVSTLAEVLSPIGRPYKYARYHSEYVRHRLLKFIGERRYDVVLWVFFDFRNVLDRMRARLPGARILYDSIDSPYLHYVREPKVEGIRSLVRTLDLWKTRRWENRLLNSVDLGAYTTALDAAAAGGRVTPVAIIPNGIYFGEDQLSSSKRGLPRSIGFLGNMGYRPNIEAVLRLYERVYMPLRGEIAGLRLVIIGRSPASEVVTLRGGDVEVTGTVESIWPHISRVSAFVYPMNSGAGLQNKVLEAMHVGKPVVTTEICARSIGARDGDEILVGRTDEELRYHTRMLLEDPNYAREIGLRGKAYVDRTFELSSVLRKFERFLFSEKASEESSGAS